MLYVQKVKVCRRYSNLRYFPLIQYFNIRFTLFWQNASIPNQYGTLSSSFNCKMVGIFAVYFLVMLMKHVISMCVWASVCALVCTCIGMYV